MVVLWPPGGGWPLPRALAEWLGVVGGFAFALNNVMLRREAGALGAARALAMFVGGVLVAGAAGRAGSARGGPCRRRRRRQRWHGCHRCVRAGRCVFLAGNLALQYGAARLPANVTAVIMLTEVVFASVLGARAGRRPLVCSRRSAVRRRRRRADRGAAAAGWRRVARGAAAAPLPGWLLPLQLGDVQAQAQRAQAAQRRVGFERLAR